MSRRLPAALVLLGALLASTTAHAGAWTPPPEHGYAKFWVKWHWGWGFVAGGGRTHRIGNYHDVTLATYGDLGIAEGWAVFWHSDLVRTYTLRDPLEDRRQAHVAPGDPALGFRWQFVRGDRLAMSTELSARAPVAPDGSVQEVRRRQAPHEEVGALRVGAGAWSVRSVWHVGYAFDRAYVAASLGYQYRAAGYADRLSWSAEVGGRLRGRLSGRLRASGSHSLPGGDPIRDLRAPRDNSPNGLGNGSSWMGIAMELDLKLSASWFLGLTVEGGAGPIRRLSGGPVISLSVSTQY